MAAEAPKVILTTPAVETNSPVEICQNVFDFLHGLAEATAYAGKIPDLTDNFTIVLENNTEQARHLMAGYYEAGSSVSFTIRFGNRIEFRLAGSKSEAGVVISHLNNYNLQKPGQSEALTTRLDQNFRHVLDRVDEVTLMVGDDSKSCTTIDEPTRIGYLLAQARENSGTNNKAPITYFNRQAAGSSLQKSIGLEPQGY